MTLDRSGGISKVSFAWDSGILSRDIQIDTPLAQAQQKIGIPKSHIKSPSERKTN